MFDASVAGFARRRVKDVHYPGVILTEDLNSKVSGKIMYFSLLELELLDGYEGNDYERVSVAATLLESQTVLDAFMYKWSASTDRLLSEDWNYDDYINNQYCVL